MAVRPRRSLAYSKHAIFFLVFIFIEVANQILCPVKLNYLGINIVSGLTVDDIPTTLLSSQRWKSFNLNFYLYF
ncbi:hypothetical protein LY76DRAFT_591642 [Colletotrichum caudatum]|nr:hypothetical protein LY76DRAFT_591642 [Colletotrichum caudatum]